MKLDLGILVEGSMMIRRPRTREQNYDDPPQPHARHKHNAPRCKKSCDRVKRQNSAKFGRVYLFSAYGNE